MHGSVSKPGDLKMMRVLTPRLKQRFSRSLHVYLKHFDFFFRAPVCLGLREAKESVIVTTIHLAMQQINGSKEA